MAETTAAEEAIERARMERISYLKDSLKDEERLICDEKSSLVNVLPAELDCSKFKQQFRNCVSEKGDKDECKHEFLLYAMCAMKQESQASNKGS